MKVSKLFLAVGILLCSILPSSPLHAQVAGVTLSGIDPSGPVVMPVDDQEVPVSAEGFGTGIAGASLAPSRNVAEAALQRALARAVLAAFSPSESMMETHPAYPEEVAFSADQAQGNPQD